MFKTRANAAMTAVTVLTVFAASTEVRAQIAADGFSGVVYEDVDSNGAWEPGVDRPLAGWLVYADLNRDRSRQILEPQAFSGPDGSYFVAVGPGTFSVRLEVTGDWAPLGPSSGAAEVTIDSRAIVIGADVPALPGPPVRDGDPEFSVTEGVHFGVFRPAAVGDLAWMDLDGDGRRSAGEPGVSGVLVRLLAASTGALLDATVSDESGLWRFDGLLPGFYRIQIVAPAGFRFSEPLAGPADVDSDIAPASGLSATFELVAGQALFELDAGLVRDAFIRFEPSSSRVVEGSTPTVLVSVRLDIPSGIPLPAPIIVSIEDEGTGTAIPGLDYAIQQAAVTFPVGSSSGTVITYPVQILDDGLLEGLESVRLRMTSLTGPATFSSPRQLDIVIEDDDGRGFTVTAPQNAATDENGGQTSFAVVLDAMPGSTVVIQVRSSDPGEGVVSPDVLVFSATTWNVAQTVTITGVDDAVFDGTAAYSVVLDPAASEDDMWAELPPVGVPLLNRDNEVRITGRLWQDLEPSNDVRDDSDGRLSAWPVRAENGFGTVVQSAMTDATGSYEFVLSGGGTYRIAFPPELGYVRRNVGPNEQIDSDVDEHGIASVSVVDGSEALSIDAGITADHGWAFDVRVFLDLDRDGVRDVGEGILPGVSVSLLAMTGSPVFSARSSESNTSILQFVSLHQATPGEYRLAALVPAGYIFTAAGQGADRSADSDIDPASGMSAPFRLEYPGCCTQSVSGIDVGVQTLEYALTLAMSGNGKGRVLSQPEGISCSEPCSAHFPAGTTAVLTAIPDPGSVFAGWSGECSGSSTCSLVMNRARTVTAHFVLSGSPRPLLQRWMVMLAVGGDTRRFRIDVCEDQGPWLQAPLAATALLDLALEYGWGSSAASTGCSDDRIVVRVVDEGLGIILTKEVLLPGPAGTPRLLVVRGVARPRPWPEEIPGGRPLDVGVYPLDSTLPVLQLIYDVPESGTAGMAQDSPLLLDPGSISRRGFGSAQPTLPSLGAMLITSSEGDTTVFVGTATNARLLVAHGFVHPMSWERGLAVDGVDSLGVLGSLVRGGRVSGRVFSDLDRSGTWEWSEPGLAGVPITIYRNGVVHSSTESDGDGRWVLALAPGAYVVEAGPVLEGGALAPVPITLAADNHISNVFFAVAAASGVLTEESNEIPFGVEIDSVFPNPFLNELSVSIRLAEPVQVSATLYDLVGRRTEVLAASMRAAGSQVITLSPPALAAGVYLLVLRAGSRTISTPVIQAR